MAVTKRVSRLDDVEAREIEWHTQREFYEAGATGQFW